MYVLIDHCCDGNIIVISKNIETVKKIRKEYAEKTRHIIDELILIKVPVGKMLSANLEDYSYIDSE